MRFRLGALGSVVAAVGALSSSCTETGVEPHPRGPVAADVQASSSGTLVVTGNTTLTGNHLGNIQIAADNITLDCAGDTVFGPGVSGFSGGIEVDGRTGVTVTHCTVTGFNVNGVFGGGTSNSRFEANLIYGNTNNGIHLDLGTGNAIVGNTSRSNGGIGIALTRSTQSRIEGNTTQGNTNTPGIALLNGSHDNVALGNTSSGNSIGFSLDDNATANEIRENAANANSLYGFFTRGSSNNVFVANTALQNAIGFVLDNATGNQLRGNNVNLNRNQGIQLVRAANDNVLDSNTVNRNLIGIEADDGTGSNTIRHNVANGNTLEGFKFFMSNSNTVTSNVGNTNGTFGFLVFGGSSFNSLTGNVGHANKSFDALDDGLGSGNVWANNNFGTTAGIP